MMDTIRELLPDLTDLIKILVGLLKGDAGVLSTEGSLAGSFGGEGLGSVAPDAGTDLPAGK